jgi:pimeloyl-ACP methyl ester carboxylesterase
MGVDHRLLLDVDEAFAGSSGFERIYVDLPGAGRTPPLGGAGSFPELLDWFDLAVDDLVGRAPFAAVANSMGALLARDAVARRPGQCLGLALLAPVIDPVRSRRTLPAPRVVFEDPELMRSLAAADAKAYAEMAVVRSRESWERYRRSVLPGIRSADAEAGERLESGYEPSSLRPADWERFDRPVLIVTGRQDAVVGFEDQFAFARRLPRATFAALDRAGHNVQIDQPAAVRALLREWGGRVRAEAQV